jgi:hypothetical protein
VSGPGKKNLGRGRDHVNNCVPNSGDRSVDESQVMKEARCEDKPNVTLSARGREGSKPTAILGGMIVMVRAIRYAGSQCSDRVARQK